MTTLNGLLVAAMLLLPTTAVSGTLYNNTALSGAAIGLTGSDRTIQIDDVLVPSSRDPSHLPLAITSITLDLSAAPGQSGRFSIYLFPVKSEGPNVSFYMKIDGTPVPGPASIVLFGTAMLVLSVLRSRLPGADLSVTMGKVSRTLPHSGRLGGPTAHS